MAYRELELTLLSAQELKSVNLITRMDVYAVVSISGHPLTRQCTEPDIYGGRNPCWNATFRFAIPPTAAAAAGASLHVLLRTERFLGDRDVGEVVIPLSDILAGATGVGPQPPQVASYQVRKLHRWEPRGVLNVSYRLGPVVAPVLERVPEKPVYAPVAVGAPPHPSHQHPSAVSYQQPPAPAPAPGLPVVRVAEHEHEAAQKKPQPPVVLAYPVGVPQQQASHPPAKPEAYRPPPPSPPPPRPAAKPDVYRPPPPSPPPPRPAARHEEAGAPAPAPAPAAAWAPSPGNTRSNNGFSQPGPTHVYMGPHSQIIFGGVSAPTTGAGPPTRTTTASPARSIISPTGTKGDGNWALLTQGNYASAPGPVISPWRTKEDPWRPSELSQSQQQVARSPVAAAAPSPQRLTASPFSSRSSSFSSPLSPYSSAHPSPSSSSSSAHSFTRSPYTEATHNTNKTFHSHGTIVSSPLPSSSSSAHSSTRSPYTEATHDTNKNFHSHGTAVSSPLPSSSSLMVPNHYRGAVVSSPLSSSSSPMVPNHYRGTAVSSSLPSSPSPIVHNLSSVKSS